MKGTFERTGLSLPLNGSEDAEKIRFDGIGVDPVSVDSDEDSDDESELEVVEQDIISDQRITNILSENV